MIKQKVEFLIQYGFQNGSLAFFICKFRGQCSFFYCTRLERPPFSQSMCCARSMDSQTLDNYLSTIYISIIFRLFKVLNKCFSPVEFIGVKHQLICFFFQSIVWRSLEWNIVPHSTQFKLVQSVVEIRNVSFKNGSFSHLFSRKRPNMSIFVLQIQAKPYRTVLSPILQTGYDKTIS